MASTYEHSIPGGGTIEFDFTNQEANVSSDVETLTAQQFLDAARDAEAQIIAFGFPPIVEASGKEYLDVDNNIRVMLTVALLGTWVIYSERSSGRFRVLGGNLIRDDGEDIFKANTQITYINIQQAAGTITEISGGTGFTSDDRTTLGNIRKLVRADQSHTKTSVTFYEEGTENEIMSKSVSGSKLGPGDSIDITQAS